MPYADLIKRKSYEKEWTLSMTNIDDVISTAYVLGIRELSLSKEEMNMATFFYLANCGDKDSKKPNVLRRGKIDELLGVKLFEENE